MTGVDLKFAPRPIVLIGHRPDPLKIVQSQLPTSTIATAGRVAMMPAALASFAALFTSHVFALYSLVDIIALGGAVTLAAAAVSSVLEARRTLDVGMVLVAGALAGFLCGFGTEPFVRAPAIALLAWLLLTASSVAVGVGLATGEVAEDPRARTFVDSALVRLRTTPAGVTTPVLAMSPASSAEPGTPVAGWYEEEPGGTHLRWWDGSDWTDNVRART